MKAISSFVPHHQMVIVICVSARKLHYYFMAASGSGQLSPAEGWQILILASLSSSNPFTNSSNSLLQLGLIAALYTCRMWRTSDVMKRREKKSSSSAVDVLGRHMVERLWVRDQKAWGIPQGESSNVPQGLLISVRTSAATIWPAFTKTYLLCFSHLITPAAIFKKACPLILL